MAALPSGFAWFVLNTERNRETSIDRAATALGFPTFFPSHLTIVTHARQAKTVRRPLFELYTFVAFNLADRPSWAELLHIRGVNIILGMQRRAGSPLLSGRPGSNRTFVEGKSPVAMPLKEVETLMQIAALHNGSIPLAEEGVRALKRLDRVRIIAGAFEGWEAIVDTDPGIRVSVLLDIFGRPTKTSVPRDDLVLLP